MLTSTSMEQHFLRSGNNGVHITNIKFSVKIIKGWCLHKLYDRCSELIHNHCRLFGSKLVIKVPNQSKRIIVFQKKKGSLYQHINCTGVNTFDEIERTLRYASEYLNCAQSDFIHFTIDNIWGKSLRLIEKMKIENVSSLNLRLLLSVLKETSREADITLRFRPEIFSAIVLRAFSATTLIYSTGACIIVGARNHTSLQKISELLSTISPCLVSNLVLTKLQ